MNWKRVSLLAAAGSPILALLILKMYGGTASSNVVDPFDRQVQEQIDKLKASSPDTRARAAESLGYLRGYAGAEALEKSLRDESVSVRRASALALAWSGGRAQVPALLKALEDEDWSVGQAAAVALNNLTGFEPHFDAMSGPQERKEQAARWSQWWAEASKQSTPAQILALLQDDNLETRLRGVRALGAVGGPEASARISAVLNPYLGRKYDSLSDTEKHLAEACIHSLGRLRAPDALPLLIGLLDQAPWARYSADALGDFGSAKAVAPMIAAYVRSSRPLNGAGRPKLCPEDDCVTGDATLDRIYETPYAIAQSLVRLPLYDAGDIAALRNAVPYLLTNVPADWDGGVVYVPETHHQLTAYLLDKTGLREAACDAAFQAATGPENRFSAQTLTDLDKARLAARKGMGRGGPPRTESALGDNVQAAIVQAAGRAQGDAPLMATWLPGFCNDTRYVHQLISLLGHENGWLRINAAKALMFAGAGEAIEPIAQKLAASHSEAEFGFSGAAEHEEYADPTPRWREAFIRALGRLQAKEQDRLLIRILEDERNVVDIRYSAAQALDELGTPAAIAALQRAESGHPLYSIRVAAREALWRRGLIDSEKKGGEPKPPAAQPVSVAAKGAQFPPKSYVYIQGENNTRSDFNDQSGVDPWRETYTVNNPSPTPRMGRNLFLLTVEGDKRSVKPLTRFEAGYVGDCEVSWDARKIIFTYRHNDDHRNYSQVPYEAARLRTPEETRLDGKDDPWWHIWEINTDGSGLRQITHGPYHDAGPAYLPDGRIVFTSTRLGLRDEYHGFAATGLAVMNPDGTDIRVIGQNLGGDRDPAIMNDGRIVFSRLDVFYSRLKAEVTLQAAYPDGTKNVVLYGPERRAFWVSTYDKFSAWTQRDAYGGTTDNRNRALRMSQAQPLDDGRLVAVTSAGLVVVGPGTAQEKLVPHDKKYAVTSPFPIGHGKVVAAASEMQFQMGDHIMVAGSPEFAKLDKGLGTGANLFKKVTNIDLGLYIIDIESGEMTPLYNDPKSAEFEARPIVARTPPAQAADGVNTWSGSYTARLFASSVFNSRHERVRTRGKILRVIEGQPFVSRHESQENAAGNGDTRWKNHAGTHARILATVPLAADGSFYVEAPADRLLQLQVLDSDRRVLGNQTFWMYARPGETKGCVGCHESADLTVSAPHDVMAVKRAPLPAVPHGGEYTYRAKTWIKGMLPDEIEESSRTARAVSLLGRQ